MYKRANLHLLAISNKIFSKSKRSQSEIITTVLIILLVLAAVVIVWQVVSTTVKGGAEAISDVDQCFNVALEIEPKASTGSCSNTTAGCDNSKTFCEASAPGCVGTWTWNSDGEINVKRNPGKGKLKKIAVVVDGNKQTEFDASGLEELGITKISSLNIPKDGKVEIYAIVGDSNHLCTAIADSAVA